MANPEQLEYLQHSADDWNIYRREHSAGMNTLIVGKAITGFSAFV